MASRWGSTALAVALLSLLLLSNATAVDTDQEIDASAEKAEAAAAEPVLRLPSDRAINPVEDFTPLSGSKVEHQDADGSSAADQTPSSEIVTLGTAVPATTIPSLKVSLIPIRRHAVADGGGLHRVHLRGTRGFFWFMRPRHHSRLFHQLFLDGRQPDEVSLGGQDRAAQMILRRGLEMPLPMEMNQDQEQQQQQPRVLAFRIRRLGPHHHRGMMHDCAWRKRLEALAAADQHKGEEDDKPQQEGFPALVKRFTFSLNPLRD